MLNELLNPTQLIADIMGFNYTVFVLQTLFITGLHIFVHWSLKYKNNKVMTVSKVCENDNTALYFLYCTV